MPQVRISKQNLCRPNLMLKITEILPRGVHPIGRYYSNLFSLDFEEIMISVKSHLLTDSLKNNLKSIAQGKKALCIGAL